MQYQQGASPAGVGAAVHLSAAEPGGVTGVQATSYGDYKVIRRNGAVVAFEPSKIAVAMTKAFIAVRGGQGRGFGGDPRTGRKVDRQRRFRADASPAGRRDVPY